MPGQRTKPRPVTARRAMPCPPWTADSTARVATASRRTPSSPAARRCSRLSRAQARRWKGSKPHPASRCSTSSPRPDRQTRPPLPGPQSGRQRTAAIDQTLDHLLSSNRHMPCKHRSRGDCPGQTAPRRRRAIGAPLARGSLQPQAAPRVLRAGFDAARTATVPADGDTGPRQRAGAAARRFSSSRASTSPTIWSSSAERRPWPAATCCTRRSTRSM